MLRQTIRLTAVLALVVTGCAQKQLVQKPDNNHSDLEAIRVISDVFVAINGHETDLLNPDREREWVDALTVGLGDELEKHGYASDGEPINGVGIIGSKPATLHLENDRNEVVSLPFMLSGSLSIEQCEMMTSSLKCASESPKTSTVPCAANWNLETKGDKTLLIVVRARANPTWKAMGSAVLLPILSAGYLSHDWSGGPGIIQVVLVSKEKRAVVWNAIEPFEPTTSSGVKTQLVAGVRKALRNLPSNHDLPS